MADGSDGRSGPDRSAEIRDAFKCTPCLLMMGDLEVLNWTEGISESTSVRRADARQPPDRLVQLIDGLISSPPYANRHDYSRVFHIALLLLGEAESDVMTDLRHRSIRSHVEAKPPRGIHTPASGV